MINNSVPAQDLEAHAIYLGVIALVLVLGILLTGFAIADVRARRRDKLLDLDEILTEEQNLERGWHG